MDKKEGNTEGREMSWTVDTLAQIKLEHREKEGIVKQVEKNMVKNAIWKVRKNWNVESKVIFVVSSLVSNTIYKNRGVGLIREMKFPNLYVS